MRSLDDPKIFQLAGEKRPFQLRIDVSKYSFPRPRLPFGFPSKHPSDKNLELFSLGLKSQKTVQRLSLNFEL